MATPQVAAREIRKLAAEVETNANLAKQEVAETALRDLLANTPRLTGRARANWRIGINKRPARQVKASNDPSSGFGTIKSSKPGDIIYIVNRVPYIGKLNRGSSAKAPAAFLERALMAARAALTRFF